MILITTAGKVGTQAALSLAAASAPSRVLVRHPDQHPALHAAGVELAYGDLEDRDSIRMALEGVTAIVLVSPAVPAQELLVIEEAARCGVSFVVKVTSKASPDSPIARRRGQSEIEAGLIASGIPHALLRSNAYMDNFLALAPAIATTNGFASSAADGRVGLIDALDVGDVAAAIVANPAAHHGRTYWLTGPELLSYRDAAEILSDVTGRHIEFAARTAAADEQAMIEAGVPATVAAQNAQAFSLIAEGDAEWASNDVQDLLERAPRSFRDFAVNHRSAFASADGAE
jgi:uncharacterized protein YbjT (DUF2867 family)